MKSYKREVDKYVNDVLTGKKAAGMDVKLACKRYLDDQINAKSKGFYFDEQAASIKIAFTETLWLTKGEKKRFILEPWQKFIYWNIFGWRWIADGTRRFREAYVEIPKKNGKALALDTPIPTPDGWKTMGSLKEGDALFDENGKVCHVTFATDVMYNRKCYEMVFSDGTKVIADAEHLWETQPYRTGRDCRKNFKGKKKKDWSNLDKRIVFTTEKIKETLYFEQGVKKDLVANHRIKNCQAVEYPKKDLPVNPYILGFWLGDGDSESGRVTIGGADIELIEHIKAITPLGVPNIDKRNNCGYYTLGACGKSQKERDNSIAARLRKLNLFGNKHIPDLYLQSSIEDRWELLKGLMDTDGYCSKAGQCEFTTTSELLCKGFMELCRSLGLKPSVKIADSYFEGRRMGLKYRVQFWCFSENTCFKLQRKKDRLKNGSGESKRSNYRQIVEINDVESVPVRCIQVDSPRSLFLVTKSFIPTHNTSLGAAVGNCCLVADGELGAEVYAAAFTRDQAKICYDESASMLKRLAEESAYIKTHAQFRVHHFKFGDRSKFEAVSHDANNTEGKNAHCVIFDEYHVHKNDDVKNSLRSGMAARKQPLFFIITTAGSDRNGPCYEYRNSIVKKVLDGTISNEGLFGVIYSIDEGDDWQDPKVWEKANPNYGVSVTKASLLSEFEEAKVSGSKEVDFKTKHLNVWTDSAVTWITADVWENPTIIPLDEYPVAYGGLDVAVTNDLLSYSEVYPVEGGLSWKQWAWTHEEKYKELEKLGLASVREWVKNGILFVCEGNCIDLNQAKDFIVERTKVVNLQSIAADQAYTGNMFTDLENEGIVMFKISQSPRFLTPFIRDFETDIKKKVLFHQNDPVLGWMASNVLCLVKGNNLILTKQSKNTKIDGIMSGLFARTCWVLAPYNLKSEPTVEVW